MSQRLAERAARALGPRLDRRGFLARSALVGTALTAAPSTYVLRPGTAYAAVCNCSGSSCDCGSACCDGYTEFCCTLSGQNRCPPGTLKGGWWRVDASGFCGGGSRYYVDCNATCGSCGCGGSGICGGGCSGTLCGCGRASCGNRKTGCTGFRYGQCNQHLACLGPIVCRVVSCVPPWQSDAACGSSVRVDNATASHHRGCLTGSPFGRVDAVSAVPGGVRVRGWAVDPNTTSPIRVHVYVDGVARTGVTANRNRGDVAWSFPGSGGAHGFDVEVRTAPGARQVCVYAIDVGEGGNVRLACRTVNVSPSPFGSFEFAGVQNGKLRVKGWALDPNTNNPIRVHIYANGKGMASLLADQERPDVGTRHGRGTRHGFDARLSIRPGTHSIQAFAIDVGAGGANRLLGTRRVVWNGSPFGRVDSVTPVGGGRVRVVGWAIDGETRSPIRVHIYRDGGAVASIVADVERPALATLGHGTAHGFDATVTVGAGSHQVCAYAIDVGAGSNVQIGCVQVAAT